MRLMSTYEKKVRQTEEWEDQTVNSRLQEVQNENHRLRGQLDSIVSSHDADWVTVKRDSFFENQKMTQERLTELQRERNVLKENLDTLKEELFNKKKERGVWDIEQEQHESKMQSLEQEKAMLLEAVDSIK